VTRPWTDGDLYKKYGLTESEIAFIEGIVRPMEITAICSMKISLTAVMMSKPIEEILTPKPEARPHIYAYSIYDKAHQASSRLDKRRAT